MGDVPLQFCLIDPLLSFTYINYNYNLLTAARLGDRKMSNEEKINIMFNFNLPTWTGINPHIRSVSPSLLVFRERSRCSSTLVGK